MRHILLCLICFGNILFAGLHPDYDPKCDSMKAHACRLEEFLKQPGYQYAKVPNVIHRIWFGFQYKLPQENRQEWEIYARQQGFEYKLWTEADLPELRNIMLPQNYQLLSKMLNQRQWWGASDIVRMELLKNFGGIYIDCDFHPPQLNGVSVNFFDIISNQGLTIILEHDARNIGSHNAIFVCNNLIAAPSNQPAVISYCDQVYGNAERFNEKENGYDAMYSTGPFLWNKVLNGTYSVISWDFLKKYKCYFD